MEVDADNGQTASRPVYFDGAGPAVHSRQRALARLVAAVRAGQDGPALITGEPGAGKTWLARRLAAELPAAWQSVSVDVSPSMDEQDFLTIVGHGLGVTMPDRIGAARLLLGTMLRDDLADGRRWLLIVDEAQRASPVVWNAIQTLLHDLGGPEGFSAMLVLGETELARALETRAHAAFATSLSDHIHLPPIDLDEARELLGDLEALDVSSPRRLEELYRDARGNPSRLLRLAGVRRAPSVWTLGSDTRAGLQPEIAHASLHSAAQHAAPPQRAEPDQRAGASEAAPDFAPPMSAPPLVPSKPPLRIEDGLVEVGWEGDLEAEYAATGEFEESQLSAASDELAAREELVEDRYAALQAWTEWKQNRERGAAGELAARDADASASQGETAVAGSAPSGTGESCAGTQPPPALPPQIRTESHHEFAPYSQLFTRLRQSKQPGS
jgi:general secretion pathway protein A